MANSQTFTLNIKAVADMKDVQSNIQNIQSALSKLKLPDNLKASFKTTFNNLEKELENYQRIMANGFKTKGSTSALEKSGNNILRLYDDIVKKINSLDDTALKKAFEDMGAKEVQNLKTQLDQLQTSLKNAVSSAMGNSFNNLKTQLKDLSTTCKTVTKDGENLGKELSKIGSTTLNTFINNLSGGRLDLAEKNFTKLAERIQEVRTKLEAVGDTNTSSKLETWINNISQAFEKVKTDGNVKPLLDQINQLKENLKGLEATTLDRLVNEFKKGRGELDTMHQSLGKIINDERELSTAQAEVNRELASVKSRIQYFLGLNNAINLVKRAIRSAVETIKELDKAMTETAVVTDFSVSDMWEQLPEYTKRANELGVTTQAAYEAATLYYQQGLSINEVNALSVETLKMARIAGLDAAEATDRMTNALRGFNMELNTTNAQRVDDVYSELAANTASNVDEISTAMTKVASLAHSANMEFETTAAFLSQIIETTRESAETAGTALKTVVARFSEVKKLVDTDQLKGTDEEGNVVDVNKVSEALRTAGIDLNKYFLGEVGLDDIFMELSAKWDSLNSVQQRYIATQAAGSRQQSRFIALMQDNARMQELVGKAYNSSGASARQFAKTQESLESKLARLKNAWNEFLMGLTNSTMVKTFIDLLTDLLNVINKLTSAFGEGSSSILKWIATIATFAGIKRLFMGGGLIDRGLMTILSGTGLGQAAVKGGLLSGLTLGGKGAVASGLTGDALTTAQKAAAGATATRTPLIFGSGSLLANAGKGIWGGAQSIGSLLYGIGGATGASELAAGGLMSGTAGLTAGLTGVATALGAVAAAVAVVYASYQAWLNLTPTGQAKLAEKYAKSLNNVASAAQETASSAQNAKQKLTELNEAEASATTIAERDSVIQERNKYIQSLLEENKAYAEYLNTDIVDGKLVLTLDDEGISKVAADAAQAAVTAAVNASFAQSSVSDRQAAILRNKLSGVDLEKGTITTTAGNTYEHEVTRALTEKELNQYRQYQIQLDSLTKQAQNEAEQAFAQIITSITNSAQVSDQVANLMSEALATGFDGVELPSGSGWWRSRGHWQNEYRELYGTEAGSNLKTSDIYRAVRLAQNTQQETQQAQDLADLVTGKQGENITKILASYLGKGDFEKRSLASVDTESDSAIYKWLGVVDDSTESANQLKDNLIALANALNIGTDKLLSTIKEQAKLQKKAQAQNVINTATQMGQAGVSKQSIEAFIQLDDIEAQNLFQSLYDSFDSSFLTDGVVSALLTGISEGDTKLTEWVKNIDLNNPITAFHELTEAATTGKGAIKDVASQLLEAGNATQQFSAANQIAFLTMSEGYDDISEALGEYIKENGHISSANIREVAESSETLNTLLKNGTVSAKALATALEGIETGEIQVWDLNDAVIAALNSMDDLDGMVQQTIDDLNDFDPGYDENDITDFITTAYETITENVEKGAIGNNQNRTYLQKIFGDDIFKFDGATIDEYGHLYEAKVSELTGILEANQENMFSAWQSALGTYTTAAGETLEIFTDGNEVFIEGAQVTTDELVKIVAKATGLGEQWASMMVADYKNYSPDFWYQQSLADLGASVESWYDALPEIDGQKIYDTTDIDTLAKLFGVGADEVTDAINQIKGAADKLKGITWTNEDGERTAESIKSALSQAGVEVKNTSEQYSQDLFDYDNFKNAYNQLGIPSWFESDFNAVLGVGDTFTAKFFGETTEVSIREGQTAGEAYAEAYQKAVNTDLAKQIGDAFKEAFTGLELDVDAETGLATIKEVQAEADTAQGKLDTLGATDVSPTVGITDNATLTLDDIISKLQTLANTHVNPTVEVTTVERMENIGASGGTVPSYANGSANNVLKPGLALTGEEGPEIIWNKDKGYAYITGKSHPEFQTLQSGDRVFNAQETHKILHGAATGGKVPSLARGYGGAKKTTKTSSGSGSSDSGSSSSDSDYTEETTWYNEMDWLYDLMEDIAEYERQQTILQAKYELAVEDLSSTGRDLFKLTQKELVNLQTQLKAQETAYTKRLQQMGELQTMVNAEGYGRYVQWNQKDQTLEIDWDAIEAIQDKDTYDEVTDWIDRMEEVQDQMDDANETIWDIKQQIQELQDRYLEKYLDFQDRVMDAVVAQYQSTIDNLSELNDKVNDTNSAILDSIQKEIDLERQIRDNTDTEKNISDMEARLAYMQRDTTGANEGQIRALEKQLEDARESYSDTLVDQAVDRLSEANDAASAQREKQIELMQAQLDYWQESGGLWGEVANLIASGFASNGSIITGSDLWETLKKGETWDAMSAAQKKNWANELILETNEVGAHLIQISDGNTVNSAKVRASIADERGILTQNISAAAETVRAALPSLTGSMGGTPEHSYTAVKTDDDDSSSSSSSYTTDELNSFLSTLDDNFLQLADVMPAVSSGSVNTTNNYGSSPFNVNVNVGSIASDYDVDSMINRIKDELYNSASYRTGNTLSFIR